VRPSIQESKWLLFQNSGACYNSGKLGHCANDCTARMNSGQNQRNNIRFQGKCGNCGMKGHTFKDCWTREENKDKRQKNWRKPSEEKAVIAVESKKNEKIT
jgi:hypothetical protein